MDNMVAALLGHDAVAEAAVGSLLVKMIVDALRKAFPRIDARWVHLLVLAVSVAVVSAVTSWSSFDATEYLTQVGATAAAAVGVNEVARKRRGVSCND